jgi:hypothetical protein
MHRFRMARVRELPHSATKLRGMKDAFGVIVESEEVGRAVPVRLHGDGEEGYSACVGEVPGEFAFSGATDAREES